MNEGIPSPKHQPTPLEQAKALILSNEEYRHHPYATGEVQPGPYIFEVSEGTKTIEYFGANHTTDPNDPQFAQIAERLNELKPQIVYVEGMEGINGREEQVRTRMQTVSIEEAISHGESYYTLKLAVDAGIEFESPEPSHADEITHLINQGFSRQDIFNFYMYRVIHQYQRRKNEGLDTEECMQYVIPYMEHFKQASRWSSGEIESLKNHLFADLDVHTHEKYGAQVDPIPWEGKPQTVINDISRASSHYRDEYIVERIGEGLKTHDRLFVVYGSAHAVKQEAALKSLLSNSADQ